MSLYGWLASHVTHSVMPFIDEIIAWRSHNFGDRLRFDTLDITLFNYVFGLIYFFGMALAFWCFDYDSYL